MSALPGDPTPNAFVFPPFVPPVSRPAQPAMEAPAPVEPPVEDFGMEVPLPAHDVGDPDDLPQHGFDADEAGTQPWEDAAPPAEEDLPWLEMPAGGPRVHATEDPMSWDAPAAPQPAADFSYDFAPAEPVADFAYDFAPAAEPAAEAPASDADAVAMPWVDDAPSFAPYAADAPAETPSYAAEVPSFLADEPAEAPSYEAPAESAWEPPFAAEPEIATPAEAALSAEIEPEDEFPVEAEAALAYEAAGFNEVPTTADFDAAAQIASATEPDAFVASAPSAAAEYAEVADRLETIARSLRDDPAAFLASGSGDALGLLVTGFVLGYGHGRRETGA